MKKFILTFFLLLLCLSTINANDLCKPPEVIFNKDSYNIFDGDKEMYLGEVIAETLEKNYRVITDEKANAYLQRIGDKLVKHLPKTGLKYKFHIIDTPQLNAFATAGGRIYVTRKMVAFLNSEDELAGILGHELGHAVVKHVSTDISKLFKEILEVESVEGRDDIFEKYNEFIDKRNTKRVKLGGSGHQNKQQLEADQIGVFSMVAAGYKPEAFATAWNRLTEVKGSTGSGIGDFFGKTKPAEKRLRKILNAIKTIPNECLDKNKADTDSEFNEWQSYIVTTSAFSKKEKISSLISKNVLTPNLRGDILHFQFSPDGKHIIAQDSSGISVLKREPFSFVFRINIGDAKPANFSPDSQSIVIQTYALRVEKWDIAKQKATIAREVFVRGNCWKTALSLDARRLVCYSGARNLDIYDVATNERIFRKKSFFTPDIVNYYSWVVDVNENETKEIEDMQMEFSPNGKYLLVGKIKRFRNDGKKDPNYFQRFSVGNNQVPYFAYDLEKDEEIKLSRKIQQLMKVPFAFYSDDSIIAQARNNPQNSGIFSFPKGKRRKKFVMRANDFSRPYKNELILVRPTTTNPVGVYDMKSNKFIASNKTAALDMYGNYLISESREGYIGLFQLTDNYQKLNEVGYVNLPQNNLGDVRNISLSPDLNWMAMSEKSRGAVWNLKTGEMKVYAHGFRGSYFGVNGNVYADFVGQNKQPRTMGVMNIVSGTAAKLGDIQTRNTKQFGKFLVRLKTGKDKKLDKIEQNRKKKKTGYINKEERKKRPKITVTKGFLTAINFGNESSKKGILQIFDASSRKVLWTRKFNNGVPRYGFDSNSETTTFYWAVKSKPAKEAINKDAKLKTRLKELKDKVGDYLVQVLDANTGKLIGQTLIETGKGSFRIQRAFANKNWITIIDTQNRVQLYSLSDGKRRWLFFGDNVAINPTKPFAVVENIAGQLSVYSLKNGKKIEKLLFSSAVVYTRFSENGEKLFVLTANQKYYLFDVDGFMKSKLAE